MMATCKDCLHIGICPNLNHDTVADKCPDFKDHSRIVELPCGYGQTVWVVGSKRIVECEVDEISFGVVGLVYLVSFDCDSDCDGCPFNTWRQDYSGEYSCDGEYGQAAVHGGDFGKTVFLTRKEAEAELARRTANG